VRSRPGAGGRSVAEALASIAVVLLRKQSCNIGEPKLGIDLGEELGLDRFTDAVPTGARPLE
jgi:hypothetical protein